MAIMPIGIDDPSPPADAIRLCLPAAPGAVRRALALIFDRLPPDQLDAEARINAEIVLAEALNNVVEHAYGRVGGTIGLTLWPGGEGLECLIIDRGNPLPGGMLPPDPGPQPPPTCLPEGGHGWFLIQTLAQHIRYARVAGENRLRFQLMTRQTRISG